MWLDCIKPSNVRIMRCRRKLALPRPLILRARQPLQHSEQAPSQGFPDRLSPLFIQADPQWG